ncbi:MAG TPA: hypothetical protein VFN93_04895 [Gaiellaceae bacterium]|nr:hypothetical protein [Gaiellaceae bacterium]
MSTVAFSRAGKATCTFSVGVPATTENEPLAPASCALSGASCFTRKPAWGAIVS